jgi:hypothetical protein
MKAALATPTRWWRRLSRADRRALSWLVALPTLLFVAPALAGHPAIVADNLIQNFPLRALAGRQLAGGHLPLLNPYANSGTPLLGGLNAGALYPTTLFFLVPWAVAAWVANLIVVYVGAAIGVYALVRWHALRVRAAFVAALSYTFFGAMTGQIVHIGVVQGYSLLPWGILALVALSRRLRAVESAGRGWIGAAAPPLLGFALLWGLVGLSGEPRSVAVMELLTLVVAPAVLVLRSSYWLATWRARVVYAASVAVGVVWGVAIALVQLLPGSAFISFSQRSSVSYWFFGSGSLNVRWTGLLFVQDLLGSNGALGTPHYFVGYNLPEITGYAGLLALIGSAAFLTRLTRRGWVAECRDFTLYVVVFVVGLWATWGTYTWAGRLFRVIPLFGNTRLQSRNVILVDLAAVVLLAWWVDRLEAGALDEAGLVGRRRWVTLAPAFVVVVICVAMLGWGPTIVTHLGATAAEAPLARHEWLTLGLHLAIALSAVALVVAWGRLRAPFRWLGAVLGADLAVFLVFCSTGLFAGYAVEPSAATARAALGDQGRTALVDIVGTHSREYEALGEANMNVFTRLPSVQGYGSLIATIYGRSTGTHAQEQLNPCELVRGTFKQLRLDAMAVASVKLAPPTSTHYAVAASCLRQRPAPVTNRYFGQVLDVTSISLQGESGAPFANGLFTVTFLGAHGQPVKTLTEGSPGSDVSSFGTVGSVRAAGLRVSGTRVALGNVTVATAGSHSITYQLNSPFEIALSTPSWRLVSTPGTYSIFRATHVQPADWLLGFRTGAVVSKIRNVAWGDSWVSVTTPQRVELVRSMAFLPGWRATASNAATGASVTLTVDRHGLVQSVNVPPGRWVVHFHYHAPHIEVSVAVSAGATLAWLVGAGWLLTSKRRRATASIRS